MSGDSRTPPILIAYPNRYATEDDIPEIPVPVFEEVAGVTKVAQKYLDAPFEEMVVWMQ